MITKLDFVAIPSTDWERSRRFYVETLGLRPDDHGRAEFWAGDTCLGIWEPASDTPAETEQPKPTRPQRLLASPKMIKHHLFNKFRGKSPASQKYRDFFEDHGISVDDFTVEIPESMHQKFIHRAGSNWTTRWKRWIDANPNATTTEVYQFAGQLMDEYGVSGVKIVPYK